MKKIKISLVLYIAITLAILLVRTNSNIIVEQRVCILIATYIIGMIAGLFAGFIALAEIMDKEDKQ